MRRLDIGIVGAGTAGPAAALFLARQGHAVTIYERVTNPTAIGAGIILQPTGQAVLARLGLADEVISRGERLDGLQVVRHESGPLLQLDYVDVNEKYFGVGLHRGVLFSALYAAVQVEPGVTLRLGVTCEGLARADKGRFFIVDDGGDRHGPHDLVVLADGARSRFRDDTGLARAVEPYPWGALWFVAKDPEHAFQRRLFQTVRGTRRMLGLLPTGVGPDVDGERATTPLVSLYWSIDASKVDAWRSSGFDAWREEIVEMAPEAEPVVAQIQSVDDVLFSRYFDVVMRPWNTRAVVHLGDAAHAMSPQLGQGANLALFDAMVLADSLEAEGGDVVRALHRYSKDRRAHLTYYETITRALTPFFQSDHDVLGVVRDLAMPLFVRLKPFRRAMILGMTGTAEGSPFRELDVAAIARRR
jgi:2-polyprenyl-6-methoxyphenol hydroxylase-like FAD-dependent oxidoreductase